MILALIMVRKEYKIGEESLKVICDTYKRNEEGDYAEANGRNIAINLHFYMFRLRS